MDMVACLVDNTSHLNELNLKLQRQNNSVVDLMKEDLEGECTHLPKLQEQTQGEKDVSPNVDLTS